MKLVQLNSVPIFEQLELEEAILRSGTGDWCLINTGSPPAIVMGISGKKEELIEEKATCPIIRRFTGGGCVVIDEQTIFITFIGDMPAPNPGSIHNWALAKLRPALAPLEFELRENDYVKGDKKFGGNAQAITRNRCLHHSSLLWNWDSAHMQLLKHPKKKPAYRDDRDHESFLMPLQPHFESKEAFMTSLTTTLFLENAVTIPSTQELAILLSQPHRRALQLVLE